LVLANSVEDAVAVVVAAVVVVLFHAAVATVG
jgi:hypothetical protein